MVSGLKEKEDRVAPDICVSYHGDGANGIRQDKYKENKTERHSIQCCSCESARVKWLGLSLYGATGFAYIYIL